MTNAAQSGGEDPLKISEMETRLAQLKEEKEAIQGETNPYREVHANEISEMETRLAQLKEEKEAIQGETNPVHANETFEKSLSLFVGLSDIKKTLNVLQTSQVRLRLAALKDIYQDDPVRAVLVLRDHGSELFTDLDVTDYEALIDDDRRKGLPFPKGWCLPGERW